MKRREWHSIAFCKTSKQHGEIGLYLLLQVIVLHLQRSDFGENRVHLGRRDVAGRRVEREFACIAKLDVLV